MTVLIFNFCTNLTRLSLASEKVNEEDTYLPQTAINLLNDVAHWWIYLVLILSGFAGGMVFDLLYFFRVKTIALASMPIIVGCHVASSALRIQHFGRLDDPSPYSTLRLCPLCFAFGLQNNISLRGPIECNTALLTGNTLNLSRGCFDGIIYFGKKFGKKDLRSQEVDERILACQRSKRRWEQAITYGFPAASLVGLFAGVCTCGALFSVPDYMTGFWFELPIIVILVVVLPAHDFLLEWPAPADDKICQD